MIYLIIYSPMILIAFIWTLQVFISSLIPEKDD
jgi:hypothetical protein